MYINIWHDLKTDGDYIFEQSVCKTIDEAITQYEDEDSYADIYNHTLHIEGDVITKIYLGEHTPAKEEEDDCPYAKRTVEENDEHKTLCAKFLNKG